MSIRCDLRFTFTAGAGADAFEVVEFHLVESLSETFHLDVQLSCANPAVDFGQILNRPALLTIWQGGQPVRYVHGSVTSFQQGNTGFRRTRYRAIVEPRLARLQLASDWRIFQALSVPDIATAVLKKHAITLDYEQKVTNPHAPREYCVQAGGTDYHFVERIMREEGFFYGFLHNAEGHRLIHCDRLWIFGKQPGLPVEYNPQAGGDRPGPALRSFTYGENVRTARQTQRDYNFKNPLYNQQTKRAGEGEGEGEEIYCDEFGRVKVQFPWDREGRHDEHSSCWIRVSQKIAGALWGHMAIPRIGQEVIISNFDGDPDQPVITGRSFNANQRPPYELPRHKTRMPLKSQTHKGEGFNELRFEDEAGQEEILIHAQEDQNNIVNHDETTFVGHDRKEQVEHDEIIDIGHDRTETVGNDEQVTIGQDRRHDIDRNDYLTIERNHTITTGKTAPNRWATTAATRPPPTNGWRLAGTWSNGWRAMRCWKRASQLSSARALSSYRLVKSSACTAPAEPSRCTTEASHWRGSPSP